MAIQFTAVAGIVQAIKGISDFFKKKGQDKDASKLDSAIGIVNDVVSAVRKDPDKDPELTKVLRDHDLEMEREYTKQAIAALKVMETEAGSDDAFVSRARPTMMYVGYAIMITQLIIFPVCKVKLTDFVDREIIYWFYWLFASGYLGYGVLRTVDKKGMALPFGGGKS